MPQKQQVSGGKAEQNGWATVQVCPQTGELVGKRKRAFAVQAHLVIELAGREAVESGLAGGVGDAAKDLGAALAEHALWGREGTGVCSKAWGKHERSTIGAG